MNVWDRFEWLKSQFGCEPIAWLFSDANLLDKPKLLGLLAADPNAESQKAEQSIVFNVAIESGQPLQRGRRGFRFLRIIRNQPSRKATGLQGIDLDYGRNGKVGEPKLSAQIKAGNLLGGLIWGATNAGDRRRYLSIPWELDA